MVTSIVPRNHSLDATPMNMFHLPPLVPGTSGLALPKAEAIAVLCVAPAETTAHNANWGQELTLYPGVPHLALAPDDTYPNQVFSRDYLVESIADPRHPLAVVLREFWASRGYGEDDLRSAWHKYLATFTTPPAWLEMVRTAMANGSLFFHAKKAQPVIVRGVVDLRFMTSEGPTLVEHGSVLVEHPDDCTNQWLIRHEKFAQRYNWVEAPSGGLLIPDVN